MVINETRFPGNHQDTVDRFIGACQADDRIVAAFLGGSYATGTADQYSDLDLFFITTDEAYDDFLDECESFIRQLGEPLFLEDFGVPHGCCFIFSNATEGDIWFGRESHFKNIYSGPYRILLDKKAILGEEVFPAHTPDPAEQTEFLCQQLDWFWHELSHFIKALGRRQLWFAYGQLEVMRQICVTLARLRHNFSDAYVREEPYFKVDEALPVEDLSPLKTTYCSMEYVAMLQAALVICRYYQDVAHHLAELYNLTYQAELESIMMDQVKELEEVNNG